MIDLCEQVDPARLRQLRGVKEFRSANRVHGSLTADAEKAALIWLAHRTPRWINSDHLTGLGVLAQLLAGVSYALARWNRYALLAVIFFLALNWLGDSLDGTLARVRRQLRPRYGFYVDHIVDSFGGLALMAGLALSGYMHPWVAIGLLVAFLLLRSQGQAIGVEVWDVPTDRFGSFVAGIPSPLAIGSVELDDGAWVKGFVCEPIALEGAEEITHYGDWRVYLAAAGRIRTSSL
jgi:hypothetical protein